ncbi:MAG: serine hydrolase domain-containing protein, partial [Leadbetterella sp.]
MKRIFYLMVLGTILHCLNPNKVLYAQNTPSNVGYFVDPQGFSAERLTKLDTFIQNKVAQKYIPNLAYMIIKNDKVLAHKAFGYKNIETNAALKKDDIFRIASQTKLMTTICLLMLMEEGKFHLDEPIHKFLPEFKSPVVLDKFDKEKPEEYTTRPAKKSITFRHILAHTSGISYEHPVDKVLNLKIGYVSSLENETIAQMVEKIAKRPLLSEPGTEFHYGLNTDVAGRLIEVISGKSLNDFMNQKLIGPLGLKDTYFYLPKDKHSRLVELYEKPDPNKPLELSKNQTNRTFPVAGAQALYLGGAGIVSTIEDYSKI